jgi:hypothetical protein
VGSFDYWDMRPFARVSTRVSENFQKFFADSITYFNTGGNSNNNQTYSKIIFRGRDFKFMPLLVF